MLRGDYNGQMLVSTAKVPERPIAVGDWALLNQEDMEWLREQAFLAGTWIFGDHAGYKRLYGDNRPSPFTTEYR